MTAPAEPKDGLAAERARDEKLAKFAADKRKRADADPDTGQLSPIARSELLKKLRPASTASDQVIERPARITREEGDQPEASPVIRKALVPSRFTTSSFANYQPAGPSQRAALMAVQRWMEFAIAGQGPMVALIGTQGTGKSHLLYAAVNALLLKGRPCYARAWYRLADELRYGGRSPFAPDAGALEAQEVRALLWKHRIVFLDEVRATASTAFDDTELAKYACHAYDSEIAVLLTTNVSPLSEVMGPPAASRFTQIKIEGPDWRQK